MVLQQTVPGQLPDQEIEFFIRFAAAAGKGGERQAVAQLERPLRCAGAEGSQRKRIAVKTRGDFAACLHVEADVAAEPRGKTRRRRPPLSLFCRSAQAGNAASELVSLIPAQAGTQIDPRGRRAILWIPAFAETSG